MLELAILGLLKEQELHGYELKKQLVDALGPLSRVSFGSLYPALGRLQRAGAVEALANPGNSPGAAGAPRPAVPMTGSMAGEAAAFRAGRSSGRGEGRPSRVRKVYRITPRGEGMFEELLSADPSTDDERAFSLRLAFCRYLPHEARIRLMERRRAQLVERLARARASTQRRRQRMDAYMRSLADHDTEAAERDISWLDDLIATEKGSTQ